MGDTPDDDGLGLVWAPIFAMLALVAVPFVLVDLTVRALLPAPPKGPMQ